MSFALCGGSVTGAAHVRAGRANQDAFAWASVEAGTVALVCDGCSGAPHSEVGAKVGARLWVASAASRLGAGLEPAALLAEVRRETTRQLGVLARAMTAPAGSAKDYAQTVLDHFLFTVVGVLADGGAVTTFSLGDGLVVTNGEAKVLGPFPGNEPPYLGYDLIDGAPEKRPLRVDAPLGASAVSSILLGTDGARDLAELAVARAAPGDSEPFAGVSQFWEDDRYFTNPDRIRRTLTRLQRAERGGRLQDDTTVVVVRNRGGAPS